MEEGVDAYFPDPMFIPSYCTWKIIRHSEFKNELSSKYLAPWSSFLNKPETSCAYSYNILFFKQQYKVLVIKIYK